MGTHEQDQRQQAQRQWFEHAGEPHGLEQAAQEIRAALIAMRRAGTSGARVREELIEMIAQLDALTAGQIELRHKLRAYCHQELARSYYDDEDLAPAPALEAALQALHAAGLSQPALRDQRTLCRGGEVHERLFQLQGREDDLEAAEGCFHAAHALQLQHDYARGDELGLEKPGAPGVQAAFLLDLRALRLEHAEARARKPAGGADRLRAAADAVRAEVLSLLARAGGSTPDGSIAEERDRGHIVICAEANFGVGRYEEARAWLERLVALGNVELERQACFRRLVQIARQRAVSFEADSRPASALAALVGGGDTERVAELARSLQRGKVGLALSGGGHRAALYHIGVLARLADVGALRDVETISTVSGGSIVGALYYLLLKARLEQRADEDLPHATYKEIVRDVLELYLRGVQRNVRMESIASLLQNLQLAVGSKSHSQRLGELYAQHFYQRAHSMHDLLITPAGSELEGSAWSPKDENWRRVAKVPALMLNTTCLNTGHNWHFTATWMGEPPRLRGHEIDKNERLRRAYYTEELSARRERGDASADPAEGVPAPALGEAVAASAGVPGLFPPMPITEMYAGRDVQLVDGGSHDNQGIAALLAEGCTRILCSDASGQMHDEDHPGTGRLGVVLRTSSILMDRVREVQLRDLDERERTGAIAPSLFVHLRQGLPEPEVPWLTAPPARPEELPRATPYEIDCGTQERLANLRTDLDAFTDVEAFALMCSGYLATRKRLLQLDDEHRAAGHAGTFGDYAIEAGGDWAFLCMREVLAARSDAEGLAALAREQRAQIELLGRQLEAGSALFFKAWKLSPALRVLSVLLGFALIAIGGRWLYQHRLDPVSAYLGDLPSKPIGWLLLAVIAAVLVTAVPAAKYLLMPHKTVRGAVGRFLAVSAGYVIAKVHLWIFDPIFLEIGSRRGRSRALFTSTTELTAGRGSALPADFEQRWSSRPPAASDATVEVRVG